MEAKPVNMATVPPQLGLNEPGSLQLWPMSSSYPAPTGHLETRTFLKTLAHGKKETEVVLSDKMETKIEKEKDLKSRNIIHGALGNRNYHATSTQEVTCVSANA